MNILMITDQNDAKQVEKFVDLEIRQRFHVRFFRMDNCRQAWELISANPFLFEMIYIGRTVIDFADREKEDGVFQIRYLERIYERNPRILFFMCTSRKYFKMNQMSVPYLLIMESPVSQVQIREMLERASKVETMRYGRCAHRVAVNYKGCIRMLPTGAIRYVKKVRNGILLMTECGQYLNRGSMDEFETQMGNRFLRCRGNLLINIGHVMEFEGRSLKMDDGEDLLVSRGYIQTVQQYFDKYNMFDRGNRKPKNEK